MAHDDPTPLLPDKRWVRNSFSRAAATYDEIAVLQREVGQRMLERLALIRIDPKCVVDVGCGPGRWTRALAQRYPQAHVIGLDIALGMVQHAARRGSWWQRWRSKTTWVCGDAEALPLADQSVDLLFSNLTLQWCRHLDAPFAEFQRVLRPGGLLMFSSFGPDTLKELRQSWSKVDNYNHVNAFIDMHDVGDALIRTGFSDPVMDVENYTLTYRDLMLLMRELKAIGAHNVTQGRPAGLTGRAKLAALTRAYESFRRADGLLPCTYEVVHGHAWLLERRVKIPGETHVSLDTLRRPIR